MKKNDIIRVEISDVTIDGMGVTRVDDKVIFVKDAVCGDILDIKIIKDCKKYFVAIIDNIITKSSHRRERTCAVSDKCGGCTLDHIDYNKQLEIKEQSVINNLEKIARIDRITLSKIWDGIQGATDCTHYRNKTIYPVSQDADGNILIGFYRKRSHDIIECDNCIIGDENDNLYKSIIKHWMVSNNIPAYDETSKRGVIRHVIIRHTNTTSKSSLILVVNLKKDEELKAVDKLISELLENDEINKSLESIYLSRHTKSNNVILANKCDCIWKRDIKSEDGLVDSIGDVKYQIAPNSFYQINKMQTKVLYDKVKEYLLMTNAKDATLWDMYCGVGTIGLYLAREVKEVKGFEVVQEAIENAKYNAKLNDITNATYEVGDMSKDNKSIDIKENDIVVLDPPRKGLDFNIVETLLTKEPQNIIYVSCNSATLARDISLLSDKYTLTKGSTVDMFPNTGHVETVCLLSRKDAGKRSYVPLDVEMEDYYRIKNETEVTTDAAE